MKWITLSGTDIRTSVLGFGCAPLGGRVGKRAGLRALSKAHEGGIRHFDIARSYGWGEAEGILGRFLRGRRRDEVTIATKCGIEPPPRASHLKPAKALARKLVRVQHGGISKRIKQRGSSVMTHRRFTPENVRRSLEESLGQLGTDYVDILFLHDVRIEDEVEDDVFDYLEGAVESGQLRSYGVATGYEQTDIILAERPSVPVAQFHHSIFEDHSQPPGTWKGGVITHSPFGGVKARRLASVIAEDPEIARKLTDVTDVDCSSPKKLMELILSYALITSPGVVVCSMYEPSHIVTNLRIATNPALDESRVDQVRKSVMEILA